MATAPGHRMEPSSGMGPRKTMIIMVTVVGCVAILWPKVFYPMMVGNGQNKNVIKDHRGAGCCGVVLDQETFANASISFGSQQPNQKEHQQQYDQQPNLFRKRSYVPFVEIDSIRQERPPHLRPEAMHPAMRERGRAIPHAGSIHGGERPQTPPRIVEGRPGPIPGMRPPMGAGSHQATKSANSMGFIMPLYTIGIVSFFIYTIMKLIFKKSPATPYTEVKPDPAFRSEVFTTDQAYIKRPEDGTTKLGQSTGNGELVAPAANGAAVAAVESHHAPSVQAELTIDYEQLSKQKEASQPTDSADRTVVEEELEVAGQPGTVGDSGEGTQPPHDPTTEKVVDGVVVKKVVSFEEHSAAPEAVAEKPAVTEVIERKLISKQDRAPGPVDTRGEELPADIIVEEVIEKQYAVIQDAYERKEVETVENVTAEFAAAEAIEQRQDRTNEQDDKVEESIIEPIPEEQPPQASSIETPEAPEEVIDEIPIETKIIENVSQQEKSSVPIEESTISVEQKDNGEEEVIVEIPVQAVREEATIEQQLSTETAEAVPAADELVTKAAEPIEEIPVETVILEAIEEQQASIPSSASEIKLDEVIQTSVQVAETIPSAKEDDVQELAVDISEVSEVAQEQSSVGQSINVDLEQVESELILEEPNALAVPSIESQPEQEQIIETVEVVEVVLKASSETVEEEAQFVKEPTSTEESVSAPASNEETESNAVPSELELGAPVVEKTEDEQTVTVEAVSQENVEQQTISEQAQHPDESAGEEQTDPKVDASKQVKIMTVLGASTSTLVCDVAKNIAITAERLVQEVLEKAEEFVAQEQDDHSPEPPPSYDSATQKLVDGIVIERFAPVEEPLDDLTKEQSVEEEESQQQEQLVADAEAARVGCSSEEDAAELDEVSEDTSLSVASVIENQQSAVTQVQEIVEEICPESLITTEVMSTSTSSEPVFVEGSDEDQRPTVEADTVVEEPEPVAGNLSGVAAAEETPASQDDAGVLIEEVYDESMAVDQTEGKVIVEHIVPITVESGTRASDGMTITEVTAGDEVTSIESPRISRTASNLPSPLVTIVPVMGAIDEQVEQAEKSDDHRPATVPSPETLEHVSKEALVERTLSEAAAVVNEIESIVDHIITEKLIQSGASEGSASVDTGVGSSAPPRLAASAALVVEAIESKASGVHSMADTNGLPITTSTFTIAATNRVESTIGATNTPTLPYASDSLPVAAQSPPSPSSDAFPVPVQASPPASVATTLPPPPTTTFASPAPSAHHDAPSAPHQTGSETHTSTNLHTADPAARAVAATTNGATGVEGSSSAESLPAVNGMSTVRSDTTSTARTSETTETVVHSRHHGQVPTGGVSSTVTNPKFLTLNLANYSTSDSSGNNSKSSAFSPYANRAQAPLAGSSSILLAGPGDTGTDQLMELELLRKKLDETERAMTKIIANMGSIPKGQESNVTADETEPTAATEETRDAKESDDPAPKVTNGHAIQPADDTGSEQTEVRTTDESSSSAGATPEKRSKKRDTSTERGTVKVMAMEVTAQRENGKRLSRPTTPLLPMGHSEGASVTVEEKETRSIVLDGRLPHDSKILVADSETAVEKMEPENSEEEDDAPVILSGKMTLSLINMDFIEKDATGTVAVGEIVTELHKPQEEITTAPVKTGE